MYWIELYQSVTLSVLNYSVSHFIHKDICSPLLLLVLCFIAKAKDERATLNSVAFLLLKGNHPQGFSLPLIPYEKTINNYFFLMSVSDLNNNLIRLISFGSSFRNQFRLHYKLKRREALAGLLSG